MNGLDENAEYQLVSTNEIYSGRALMHGGLLLPAPWGDESAFEIYLKRVGEWHDNK